MAEKQGPDKKWSEMNLFEKAALVVLWIFLAPFLLFLVIGIAFWVGGP